MLKRNVPEVPEISEQQKDLDGKSLTPYQLGTQSMSVILSYTKTNKLITALYMVTDIMDKDEPIRNKLRTLGTGIISDMYCDPVGACPKISEVMSFLDISCSVNIISEMNCNILRKEFTALYGSITESIGEPKLTNKDFELTDFFTEESLPLQTKPSPSRQGDKGHENSKGHHGPTRLGVQKGSTLMKALSDRSLATSSYISASPSRVRGMSNKANFGDIKKQRRDTILKVIKSLGGSATIKDIKDKIKSTASQSSSPDPYSEKTLQRELVSMVKDSILRKTGEKRWSRYELVNLPG